MNPPLNSSVRQHMITDNALSNTPLLISALIVYLILQFLTFPFYIHIFRKNQERDKNIPIFPIVEHFYKLIKLAVLTTILILAAVVLIQVFDLEIVKLGLTILMLYYAFLNLLIFVSTCLYMPIVISLRKLVHLQSSQLNHPQRYVLWQLVVILMEKSFYTSILFLYPSFTAYETMRMFTAIDVLLLPMTIQLTYVGCNRRNVQSLLASSKSILKVFCCPCVPAQVYMVSTLEPVAVGFDVSTTRHE